MGDAQAGLALGHMMCSAVRAGHDDDGRSRASADGDRVGDEGAERRRGRNHCAPQPPAQVQLAGHVHALHGDGRRGQLVATPRKALGNSKTPTGALPQSVPEVAPGSRRQWSSQWGGPAPRLGESWQSFAATGLGSLRKTSEWTFDKDPVRRPPAGATVFRSSGCLRSP